MGFTTYVGNAVTGLLRTLNVGWTVYFKWNGGSVQTYTYFNADEVKKLDPELCAMLDLARARAGVPFVITSGFRTADDNHQCGGAGHSSHCEGLAVDLGLAGFEEGEERDHARRLIRRGLELAGFNRYGAYPMHIHIDIGKSPDYTQDVEWFSATEA